MNKKLNCKLVVTLVLIILNFGIVSAQVRIHFSTGYSTYSMQKLSKLQESIAQEFPMKGETNSYPGYINFEGSFLYDNKINLLAGLSIGYGSSGARTYYGDYSGSIYFDQLAHYYSISTSIGYMKKLNSNLNLYWDLHPGIAFTKLEFQSVTKIGSNSSKDSYHFKSKNVFIEPTVNLLKKFGRIGVTGYVGFNLNLIRGKLMSKERADAWLVDDNNEIINADWSGIRIGAGISYYFSHVIDPID